MTFTHPLAKQAEEWWATHGGRHDSPEWQAYLADFADLSRRKIDEQAAEHDNQGRFGMSKAGGCTRAAALRLLGAPEEPLLGSTRVTFWIGHLLEVVGLATLRAIGVPVSPSTEDGVQWVAKIDPFMLSYSDGIIDYFGKIPVEQPMTVVSVKSAGYKLSGKLRDGSWKRYGFAQYPMDGVKKTSPGYWAQMQAEMAGTGTRQALLFVVAKDMIKAMEGDPILMGENGSLSFYAEMVDRDDSFIERQLKPVWSKAWSSVQEKDPGAPMYLTAAGEYVCLDAKDRSKDGTNKKLNNWNPCLYCSLADACETHLLTGELKASLTQKGEKNS